MSGSMFHLTVTYDSYGGKDKVFEKLFEVGILNSKCLVCNKEGSIEYEEGKTFPRVYCGRNKKRTSCKVGTALSNKKIKNVPLFLFVTQCFCLHVGVMAIVARTGDDYSTVSKYINAVMDSMCACIKSAHSRGQLKLGGPDKIVEIDEMFLWHRKYGRGRRMAKEGT